MKISRYLLFLIWDYVTAFPLATKEIIGFPEGYTFAMEKWGSVYYKTYQKQNYFDAVKQCRKDGGTLPVPKSGMSLYPEKFSPKFLNST